MYNVCSCEPHCKYKIASIPRKARKALPLNSATDRQYVLNIRHDFTQKDGKLTGGRLDHGRNRPPAVVTVNVNDTIWSGIRVANSIARDGQLWTTLTLRQCEVGYLGQSFRRGMCQQRVVHASQSSRYT